MSGISRGPSRDTNAGGVGGLNADHEAVLNLLSVETTEGSAEVALRVGAKLRVGVNTMALGYVFDISVGGATVFFKNHIDKRNYSAIMQSYDEFLHNGTVERLYNRPTARHPITDFTPITINGDVDQTTSLPYHADITLTVNEVFHGLKVYAAEAYEGPLTYTLDHENADGVTGLRYVFNVNVQAGDLLTMTLDVPSETRTGETINVDIHKGDDSEFLVRAGTDTSRPWIEITLSTFQDVLFYMEPDAHHLEFLLYDQMGVDTLHASDGALILTRDGNPIIWAF